VDVIEQLREQIKCIEGRPSVLGAALPPVPGSISGNDLYPGELPDTADAHVSAYALRQRDDGQRDRAQHNAANGAAHDASRLEQKTPGMTPRLRAAHMQDQTAFPAGRFVAEDDSVPPCTLSSSLLAEQSTHLSAAACQPNHTRPQTSCPPASNALGLRAFGQYSPASRLPAPWTLAALPHERFDDRSRLGVPPFRDLEEDLESTAQRRRDITDIPLDISGVHEIKPALQTRDQPKTAIANWEACWSAARRFQIALMARRMTSLRASTSTIEQAVARPILWCLPRAIRAEQGELFIYGLRQFGVRPADIILVETGSPQETLWVLEEALKADCLTLVVGMLDDVELTPARRLALAAQKARTPCLLLTHPRGPPMAATATRWRVGPVPSALHALQQDLFCPENPKDWDSPFSGNTPGAFRFALTLERYRAMPQRAIEHEAIVEWCDETLCLRLVSELSDRSTSAHSA